LKGAAESLSERGYTVTSPILSAAECAALVAIYGDEKPFPQPDHHGAVSLCIGDYKYFANPIPK